MLSVLFGEQFDNLRRILSFYLYDTSHILDLTYGDGKLWRGAGKTKDWKNKYQLVKNDVDPESPADIHLPFPKMPEYFVDYRFDAMIYDPPYKYDQPSFSFIEGEDKDWKAVKTKWKVEDQIRCAEEINEYLPNHLHDKGLLIVKIMDTRLKGELILSHVIIINALTNFKIIALIPYVRLGVGVFRNDRSPQTANGFYMIFKKK